MRGFTAMFLLNWAIGRSQSQLTKPRNKRKQRLDGKQKQRTTSTTGQCLPWVAVAVPWRTRTLALMLDCVTGVANVKVEPNEKEENGNQTYLWEVSNLTSQAVLPDGRGSENMKK